MKNTGKRALLDVNVFQDAISGRPGAETALAIIEHVRQKKLEGYVAAASVPILWYINRYDPNRRAKIKNLFRGFTVVAIGASMIETVLRKEILGDLEDELQYLAARETKVNYLITRNIHDFPVKDIAVVTPEQFLQQLK